MNQKELEKYIYTYGKDLYSFCCFVTHNRQEADDLYQDTFLKLYEIGEKVVILNNPKSYLMSIAVNLYRNYRRKLSIRQRITGTEVSVEDELLEIPAEGEPEEEKIIRSEEQLMVRMAVNKLSDKYRIPILLFYMEELSLTDISKILSMPEGTIKSRLHRAKKILKQKLEDMQYEK